MDPWTAPAPAQARMYSRGREAVYDRWAQSRCEGGRNGVNIRRFGLTMATLTTYVVSGSDSETGNKVVQYRPNGSVRVPLDVEQAVDGQSGSNGQGQEGHPSD